MTLSLEKRAEKVALILTKRGLTKIPAVRVGMAMDHSGSMDHFYNDGTVQEVVERLMAVALKFDDNGELDTWFFNTRSIKAPAATASNLNGWTRMAVQRSGVQYGGTAYAPVMRDMLNHFFDSSLTKKASGMFGSLFGKSQPSGKPEPAYGIFVTDGVSNDGAEAIRVMKESAPNMYWTLVGVGNIRDFAALQQAADDLDNVGFVHLQNLSLSDDALYEKLITDEVVAWVKKFV